MEKHFEGEKSDKQILTPEQESLIKDVQEITELSFCEGIGVPEAHGLEHIKIVERMAYFLALKEGADVFEVEIGAWTHDWGRKGEKVRRDKSMLDPHAKVSRRRVKDFLSTLSDRDEILEDRQYQQIIEMVGRHSNLPGKGRLEEKIVRDADKMSRWGIVGLGHLMQGVKEYGTPFYIEGRPINRNLDRAMTREENKCVIDDVNFCACWINIVETESAKDIAEKYHLVDVLREFLKIFEQYHQKVPDEIWIEWVETEADKMRQKQAEIQERFKDDHQRRVEEMLKLEDPKTFSAEKLKEFLAVRKLD